MTDLDAIDRAFLKGSGVPSLPNKGKSAVVDPLDAAFMRGLGKTPIAEVANTPRRVPFTPTPVSPTAMAGAIIRGAGEGLAQGARDLAVTAGKSIIGVGETAVGLVDVIDAPRQAIFSKLSTGRVQLGQMGKMLEDIGVDFKTTQDFLSTLYSDEQKRALQNVSDKKSAKEKLVALGANPTVPIHSVLQSIPSMMAAASVSAPLAERGMAKWLAGALGEGAVQASSAQEQYRQQSDTGYTTPKQTSLAVASGLVTAAIAAASGKISEKIGLEDVESIGASGSSRGSNLEFWRKLVGGMFMEGPVEEGFQSSTEKIAENLALGRPWDEGVEGAYTEGSVSGAIMGAAANALPSKGKSKSAPKLDADAWIKENADMLPTIAAKEKLGRKYWEKLGLPRVPEAERAEFLQKVKDTVGGVAPAVEEAPTVQEQDTPEPEAVVTPEPSKAPVPEAKAAVDEMQSELDAQTAEEDADEAAYALFGKRESKTPVPDAIATPVEPEPSVPTDTAAEVVKPVEAPVVAEPKAVEERKKGKRVPKAPKPVNKGKGVVETVVDAPVVKESLSTPVEQSPPTVAPVAAKEPDVNGSGVIDEDVKSIDLKMNDGNTISFKKTSRVVNHSKGRVIQEIEGTTKDGKFVGVRFLVNKDNKTLTIVGLASEAKGSGYGTQLLNSIKEEARKNGIEKIVADDTRATNSLKYWEKQGFKPDGGINAALDMNPAPVASTPPSPLKAKGRADVKESPVEEVRPVRGTIAERRADAIRKAMSDKGKELVSSSSTKKQSKPNSALASSVAKAKAEGNDIELVDTVSDLPADIRSQLPSDTSNIEGFYVNGKTYIIGENVTPDRAEAVVRDEMAHRKLDTAQGEELIDGFKKRMTEKDRKALIKEGYTKTRGESDADYEARLANEFIAKQARKNTSAWTEFVDSVKSFLERVGVRDLTSEEAARVILRKLRGGAATGKGVRYSLSENVWNTPQQKISSANTSINSSQLPASFRKISWVSGTRNADIGGGRFDNATEYLDGLGVENVIYDPYNRSQEHNDAAVAKISNGNSDTATVNNVLNVIAEESARESVIKQAANAISEDGVAYFLIYQGNGSGVGTPKKAGWQENRKADSYTDEIAKHFGKVTRQGNMLVASQPKKGGNDIRYSLTPAAELDEAKYESAKGIFGTKLERLGEAGFRKWVSEKLPDSAMPYAERFLSERSAMATVPKKKFVTGISRKVVDAELESMGQTPSEGGGQPSWPQLMAQAKADIKANSSAGDSLIANLIENPHPLTQEEIALLNHVKVQRWNEQVAAYESKDKKRLDAAVKRMDEVYFVSALGPDKSKSMQGAALNALKMMTDEKYELVNLVQSHYATTGDVAKPGSQVYKDLEAIAQQYKERTEVLERENARLQEEATTMNQSLADALAQAAYNQGKPKSKGKSKASKIASVADVISKKSRDYGISLIEQARKEQAALNMRASAGVDPARLLMLSKFAAGHILLGVSDVAAKVSEFYGSKISSAEMSQIMSEAKRIAADATSRIAKEAESETLASRVIPKGKGAKTATQLSEVSLKDMFREQAENGVKTFKEALPLVGKLVRDSGINATDLQIQDTYSSYINEPGVLSTDTIKKVIAAYRQEAQLLSKINDAKKGVRPHKIGIPRFPSSQEARALEKELDDLMKNVTFSGDKKPTDIASPLDAKKTWMQNEIDDLEKAIALHEERFQGEKGITDQGDIEYQRLKAQLEDVRKRYAEAFPKKPLTQEEQLAILIKQEEKNVDRWNKRVADAKSGKIKSYERVQRPYSERLAELQYQRDNAKAEVARLYELQNPGKRAREAQMRRDLAAIKEMERRMAAGDYKARQTKEIDISGDPDAMAAHLAREQTKKTYEQYKARAAWNKMSKARRIAELAKNVLMSDKAIVYSGDDSFVGRQGWFFAMTHMAEWVKSTGKGLTALDTAKSATMVQEIKESDLYKSGVYKAAGININVKDATGNFSTTDDVNLDVADKIPVLGKVAKVSGRLFGASANLMRTNFLRVVLEGSETGRKILANPYELTEKQKDFLKHVGWGVNVFTGFSNNETIKAGVLLGAPNWCLSVLENLTQAPVLNALVNGDFDAAWQLEKQYVRFYLATAALIATLSMLPSGPKDDEGKRKRNKVILDPRSNRFGIGYIPYTSIQFNTFGPLAPWVRFLGRNISGQKVSGGRVTNLRNTWLFFATDEEKAQAVPYKEGQMMDNLNFLRSKFRPLVSAAIGFQTGTDYYGNEVPRSRVLVESVSPLVPLHLIDNLVRVSPEQAAFESFMEAFGVDPKPDFNTPQYKKYEAKMKVVDEMFKLKFKDENGKSFGDRAEDIYIANAMKTLHGATDTDSSPGSQESAKMIIDDLGLDACLMLLEYQALDVRRQRSGGKISTEPLSERTSSGELSAYGKRVQKLRIISAQ